MKRMEILSQSDNIPSNKVNHERTLKKFLISSWTPWVSGSCQAKKNILNLLCLLSFIWLLHALSKLDSKPKTQSLVYGVLFYGFSIPNDFGIKSTLFTLCLRIKLMLVPYRYVGCFIGYTSYGCLFDGHLRWFNRRPVCSLFHIIRKGV